MSQTQCSFQIKLYSSFHETKNVFLLCPYFSVETIIEWKTCQAKMWGQTPKEQLIANAVGIDKNGDIVKAATFKSQFPMQVNSYLSYFSSIN